MADLVSPCATMPVLLVDRIVYTCSISSVPVDCAARKRYSRTVASSNSSIRETHRGVFRRSLTAAKIRHLMQMFVSSYCELAASWTLMW